ncbi:hypothetical protein [Halofilum ochraceum]|uniref:hypothetical protein n=1 Tax=Halofilum ochraceum TaxID=1611323 RepID=UPI0008D909BD|nr:hypothetical protein [Halofilum ochraceum]
MSGGACSRGLFLFVLSAPVAPAWGHALGGRYDLPLPLGLYLMGAGLAVAFSFIGAIALLRPVGARVARRFDLLGAAPARGLLRPPLVWVGPIAGIAGFLFIVTTALFGSAHASENPAVTLVWVAFWVGGAYLSVVFGDAWWRALDPWRHGYRFWERWAAGRGWRHHLGWPAAGMGRWPAVVLLAGVFWLELVYPDSAQPPTLAVLILAYSAVTWTGMALFGPDRWSRRGDPFGALFREFGRLAPMRYRAGGAGGEPSLELRPPGAGLTPASPVHRSTTALILLVLAAVSFDGLLATPQWAATWRTLTGLEGVSTLLRAFERAGLSGYAVISTLAFVLTVGVFVGLYGAACAGMARLLRGESAFITGRMADLFAPSLLPIGVGYHLAHYVSYLLIQGQRLIAQASDPFASGADLLGTADYRVAIDVISPGTVWYLAVAAVVLGHVIAVYAAHRLALMHLGDRRAAAISQLPLIALMIAYTVFSLWLFAQPTVEAG